MIPITQTRTGRNGNCFSACLASILELSMAEVPDFHGDGELWLDKVARWLEPRGLYYLQVDVDDPILLVMFRHGTIFHTVEGLSPRGGQHACVGANGKIVWDPHPLDGTQHGLKKIDCFGLLCARFAK